MKFGVEKHLLGVTKTMVYKIQYYDRKKNSLVVCSGLSFIHTLNHTQVQSHRRQTESERENERVKEKEYLRRGRDSVERIGGKKI